MTPSPSSDTINCAIQYHPDGYKADREQVKGRHSAGAGFLSSFVKYANVDRFIGATDSKPHFEDFHALIQQLDPQKRPTVWAQMKDPRGLRKAGTLFLPGPALDDTAWTRRLIGDRTYSLCGLTHTVSSDRVIKALGDYLTAPTQPWDALICTSTSAKAAVQRAIEIKSEFLAERGLVGTDGKPYQSPVKLPVIPLGVDAAAYQSNDRSAQQRQNLRAQLKLDEDDIACLFFGRLSFHSKVHPVPMFLAAERAQSDLKEKRLHLIFTGQFYNAGIEKEFHLAAQEFCPNVPVHFLDGNDPEISSASWPAADIFYSLSDNIQESFGLTPIEAMAAGLPCIVSDWNGYKDTVIDGETGFRIPTTHPSPEAGTILGNRYAAGLENYDRFIGAASLMTAVDITACSKALVTLAEDADLRKRMGTAGAKRALEIYDWTQIIVSYQELWRELSEIRAHGPSSASREASGQIVNPAYPSPFDMFRGHPTNLLADDRIVALSSASKIRLADIHKGTMNTFSAHLLLSTEEMEAVLSTLTSGPISVAEVANTLPDDQKDTLLRSLTWLAKYGIVEIK